MAEIAYPNNTPNNAETPLEAAARLEVSEEGTAGQDRREEREADVLVADIDAHVARTDPASLPEAEEALEAWEIPNDPLEGVPGDVALEPNVEGPPLVAVFAAQSEMEANIVRGVVEAAGIPVTFDGLPAPMLGNVFQAGETRWGDLLVAAQDADAARAAIAEATAAPEGLPADAPSDTPILATPTEVPNA